VASRSSVNGQASRRRWIARSGTCWRFTKRGVL